MAKDKTDNGSGGGIGGGTGGGIQSLDAALRVLMFMASRPGPLSLSELAREVDMPPSKVHRYLASFLHAGLAEQGGRSGKYDLGAGSIRLGLAAIGRHDFVNKPSAHLEELRDATGLTVLLSVWGGGGATVVRWERAASPIVTSMGLGTTLPLLNSSTGRIFLAYAPQATVQTRLAEELAQAAQNPAVLGDVEPTRSGVDALIERVRGMGYATVYGDYIPGLVAVAAPILDWQGEAQAAITLIGTNPKAVQDGSDEIGHLLDFCRAHSFAAVGSEG